MEEQAAKVDTIDLVAGVSRLWHRRGWPQERVAGRVHAE